MNNTDLIPTTKQESKVYYAVYIPGLGNGGFWQSLKEAQGELEDIEDEGAYLIEKKMTDAEYKSLPEFEGY